jgi:hypothetical protein
MRRSLCCTALLFVACAGEPAGPLRLVSAPDGPDTRVTLVPASNIKLSARVKPELTLTDGRIVEFDSADLTADSAYFASPPIATVPGRHGRVRGTVRASVCENDAPVCRSLELQL